MREHAAVAVVTPAWDDEWDERQRYVRHLAGALATVGEVDVLIAHGAAASEQYEGALRIRRFASRSRPERAARLLEAIRRSGLEDETLSTPLVDELVRAEGGDSPTLFEHLAEAKYEVVVFAGYRSAASVFGMRVLADTSRAVLVPFLSSAFEAPRAAYSNALARADCIIAASDAEHRALERATWRDRFEGSIVMLRALARVNPLAAETVPASALKRDFLVVATGSLSRGAVARTEMQPALLRRWAPNIYLLAVGPHAGALTGTTVPLHAVRTRIDYWRWVNSSLALLEPGSCSLLGTNAIEAMLLGVPVIAYDDGGAARLYVELAEGGIWVRDGVEIVCAAKSLSDRRIRDALGRHGAAWAHRETTDPARWTRAALEAVLGTTHDRGSSAGRSTGRRFVNYRSQTH